MVDLIYSGHNFGSNSKKIHNIDLYNGHLPIADTFSQPCWCLLKRGITVLSFRILRYTKNGEGYIQVSKPQSSEENILFVDFWLGIVVVAEICFPLYPRSTVVLSLHHRLARYNYLQCMDEAMNLINMQFPLYYQHLYILYNCKFIIFLKKNCYS